MNNFLTVIEYIAGAGVGIVVLWAVAHLFGSAFTYSSLRAKDRYFSWKRQLTNKKEN